MRIYTYTEHEREANDGREEKCPPSLVRRGPPARADRHVKHTLPLLERGLQLRVRAFERTRTRHLRHPEPKSILATCDLRATVLSLCAREFGLAK